MKMYLYRQLSSKCCVCSKVVKSILHNIPLKRTPRCFRRSAVTSVLILFQCLPLVKREVSKRWLLASHPNCPFAINTFCCACLSFSLCVCVPILHVFRFSALYMRTSNLYPSHTQPNKSFVEDSGTAILCGL